MDATTSRQEEFGAGPWAAIVVAILLAVTVGSSFLHTSSMSSPSTQAHLRPVAIHAARFGSR